jgi:hypothetical protein
MGVRELGAREAEAALASGQRLIGICGRNAFHSRRRHYDGYHFALAQDSLMANAH